MLGAENAKSESTTENRPAGQGNDRRKFIFYNRGFGSEVARGLLPILVSSLEYSNSRKFCKCYVANL